MFDLRLVGVVDSKALVLIIRFDYHALIDWVGLGWASRDLN